MYPGEYEVFFNLNAYFGNSQENDAFLLVSMPERRTIEYTMRILIILFTMNYNAKQAILSFVLSVHFLHFERRQMNVCNKYNNKNLENEILRNKTL